MWYTLLELPCVDVCIQIGYEFFDYCHSCIEDPFKRFVCFDKKKFHREAWLVAVFKQCCADTLCIAVSDTSGIKKLVGNKYTEEPYSFLRNAKLSRLPYSD